MRCRVKRRLIVTFTQIKNAYMFFFQWDSVGTFYFWVFYSCSHSKTHRDSNIAWQRNRRNSDSSAGLQHLELYLIYHTQPVPNLTSMASFHPHPSLFHHFCCTEKRLPGPVTLQCSKEAIISTAFHCYDNTLWDLKAICSVKKTLDFRTPEKLIYLFLLLYVISRGE